MATNIYLVPAIAGEKPGLRVPKYLDVLQAAGVTSIARMTYGAQDVFLLAAVDVPAGAHSTLAGNADVVAVPDLQQSVGGQVTAVRSVLVARNIPAGWITSGMSYGSVFRVVAIIFQLMQRLQGQGVARLLDGGVTLDTRFNQLPQGTRTALLTMAESFNFNTAGMSGATTLNTIIKALADQWPSISIPFGPVTL